MKSPVQRELGRRQENRRKSKLRSLLGPGLTTLVMLGVLIGLGVWQIERLQWKTRLLAAIDRAEAAPAVPLPADPSPFAKVIVSGRFRTDLQATYGVTVRDTPAGPEMGSDLLVPLERADAAPILVDRGWVPEARGGAIALPTGPVSVQGFIRPDEKPRWYSPADDPVERRFYTLDPPAIGAALGLPQAAPFTLVALGSPPPEHYPAPARDLPRPPNNHLAYAVTWFGLAAALLVIFFVYARKVFRA